LEVGLDEEEELPDDDIFEGLNNENNLSFVRDT